MAQQVHLPVCGQYLVILYPLISSLEVPCFDVLAEI